ncbi:ABC transporter g family member 14 [Phtheirospermum japonicum]|uniref:ABC transporter g family member 14 n=1 Tax=Phtheirospermum japonicum TaxID=374723 RepID=A0A830B5C2_9LAMI|nr:ABC transporter g family member 14 [Phtheirospermum japonicum]
MALSLAAPKPENDDGAELQECDTSHDMPTYSMLIKSQSYLQRVSYPITLKFEGIVYKLNHQSKGTSCCKEPSTHTTQKSTTTKMILNGITGFVRPGELLAMLGPSGSGKTTLLTALGGRHLTGCLSGNITYNDRPFSSSIKRQTGFVTQDDVLYPHLTVFETLLFTALLRLPQTLTKDEKAQHVHDVVSELGLTRCSNSVIGGPFLRGISGGERKRVSIGQEMLINPSLLLLDEPTSGLDSTGAHRIVNTLKGLARCGRTVGDHHPPARRAGFTTCLIRWFVLAQGSPIYYGPGRGAVEYFASVGFGTSITVNPADLLLDLANGIGPDFEHATDQSAITQQDPVALREFLISAYEINIAERLQIELCNSDVSNDNSKEATPKNDGKSRKWRTSWWHQFKILLLRGLRERRFEAFNKLRIFQVLSVAILGGLLWWRTPPSRIDDHVAMLFFFSVFWGFYPLYNAVFTFPQERRMLIKERSSGMYRLSAYFLARTVGDLPMDLALPTAFTCIFYWMGGLKSDPSAFVLSLLVVLFSVLVSQSLGLAFGALLMDVKQAATLASVTTIVFSMAGGYYVKQIPIFIVWLKYLSFSYYFYKLLLGIQYDEHEYYECGAKAYCRVSDHPAIKSIGLNYLWIDISAMVVMLVVYRFIAYLALHRVK